MKNLACPGQPALEPAELPPAWFAVMVDGQLRRERYKTRASAEAVARQRARYVPNAVAAVVECRAVCAWVDPYFGAPTRGRPQRARDASDTTPDAPDPVLDTDL